MGGKQSTNSPNSRQQNRTNFVHTPSPFVATGGDPGQSSSSHGRFRARTFNDVGSESRPLVVPHGLFAARYASDFGLSTTSPSAARARRRRRRERDEANETNSLPSQFFSAFLSELKCPVCNKTLHSGTLDVHLVECLSKPRISYNADVLAADAGECIICFDDMLKGQTIARLPCLCVYHKRCIDDWFQRSRTCPEHPEQPTAPEVTMVETEDIENGDTSSDQ